ncbi:transposase [Acidobacteria bacterium AH-259-O06]|nr:transposase [Acidobacteria bacterium AH-259-O06]
MKSRGEQPLRTALWRVTGVDLTRIDGIAPRAAQVVVSEVDLDLHSFPNENHFASWLRLAPRVPISGGKPLPKKNKGTGATRVAGVLRMAALSLKHSDTALGAYFRRIARRKDASVAIFATARKLAILIYRMLKYGQDYVDEGARAYQERFRQRRLRSP